MKNTRPLLFITLLLLTFAWGCSGSNAPGKDGNDVAKDTIPPVPPDPEVFPSSTFGSFGLDFINVGDTLAWRELIIENALSVKDTVFTDSMATDTGKEEIAWLARMVYLPDGMITLEADFESSLVLNRVRIESPSYKHFHTGAHIGSTLGDLKRLYPELYVRPFPEFGVIEVMPDNHNIFHIPDNGELSEDPATWEVSRLPETAKVVRIVVM